MLQWAESPARNGGGRAGRARRGIRATAAPVSHVAARRNAVAVVRMLLDRGAQARPTDARGETPLHRAAAGDAATVATLLSDRGADVCAVARDSATALHRAGLNNAVAVAPVLLDRGDNVHASADSSTPLHEGAAEDAAGALRAFVDRGASAGSPPFRVAALLVAREADIEVAEDNDGTARASEAGSGTVD